jgi:hypothetical protein
VQTLIIASVASAAASFAVARIWGPGTLFGAAAAPVIVALVSETLRRPVRTVAETAKRVPTRGATPSPESQPPSPGDQGSTAATPVTDTGQVADAEAHTWRPRWRQAVVTGLIAFAIVVGLYTVPDLIAGRSITGNGQPTTFFGGSSSAKQQTHPTITVTTTAPATVTKTATATTTTKTTTTPTTTTTASSATTTAPSTTTTQPMLLETVFAGDLTSRSR